MPVATFSIKDFEAALPVHKETGAALWKRLGVISGEYAYLLPVDEHVAIEVRSSIGRDGISAGCGEDSIRAWLVEVLLQTGTDAISTRPLGTKVSRWTTRTAGWEKRMIDVLRTLWGWRTLAGNCDTCDQPLLIFRNHTTKQIFARCRNNNHICRNGRRSVTILEK